MHTSQVEVEAHPTPHDGPFLADHLYAYNVEQTGYDDGTSLTLWVQSPTGERLAGLYGWTWGGNVPASPPGHGALWWVVLCAAQTPASALRPRDLV